MYVGQLEMVAAPILHSIGMLEVLRGDFCPWRPVRSELLSRGIAGIFVMGMVAFNGVCHSYRFCVTHPIGDPPRDDPPVGGRIVR